MLRPSRHIRSAALALAAIAAACSSPHRGGAGGAAQTGTNGDGAAGGGAALTPLQRSIADIDAAALRQWHAAKLTPAPEATRAAYIRRVTLDLIGRIPTAGETDHWLRTASPTWRAELVSGLLDSDEYAAHWADVYADLLIGRASRLRRQFADGPRKYLVDSFRRNKPMHHLAREVITATGDVQEHGAGGFIVSQRLRGGDLEKLAGETSKLFLGVQIQCAQCHDHPSDKRYKKSDFKAFAAYFGELGIRRFRDPLLGPTVELVDRPAPARNKFAFETPRFLGRAVATAPGESRRQTLARAITASPLFPLVTVNRTWGELFGAPMVAPWSDLGGETDPRHTPLLRLLARDFAKHGFDHKRLLRTIALSAPYRRSSRGGSSPGAPGTLEQNFARAAVRELTADQLFQSQLVATGVEESFASRGRQAAFDRRKASARRAYLFMFGDDEGGEVDSFSGSVPQALMVRNGPITRLGAQARPGTILYRIVAASADPGQRIEWMYMATLSRKPTGAERTRWVTYLRGIAADAPARRVAYEDLYFALLTSTEFNTNH